MTAPQYLVRNLSEQWLRGTWHSLRDAISWAVDHGGVRELSCTEAVELVERRFAQGDREVSLGDADIVRV